jgi:hypothetical protein
MTLKGKPLNGFFNNKEVIMPRFKKGPIEYYSFGKFIIDGKEHSEKKDGIHGKGKDIRLIDQDVTEWKEREGHKLTAKMITGVFSEHIEILIIGTGAEKALKCPKKVIKKIKRHNSISQVIIKRTPKACKAYNRLFLKGKKVALLAHGTC